MEPRHDWILIVQVVQQVNAQSTARKLTDWNDGAKVINRRIMIDIAAVGGHYLIDEPKT